MVKPPKQMVSPFSTYFETCSNGGADDAGHVGTHGVHQQEVGAVVLCANGLGNTCGHGNGGNAGGTNEGIDLALGDEAQDLADQQATNGSEAEGEQTQSDDGQSLGLQEDLAAGSSTDGQTQHDGADVAECVLGNVAQTIHNAAFTQQVTQHQHTDQRSGVRQQQSADGGNHDGENHLLRLADRTQLLHLDLALLVGGQQLHDGGLHQGDQSHVAVSGHGNGSHQVGSQLVGGVDSGGAVSTADDADSRSLLGSEQMLAADLDHVGHDKGHIDAKLSTGAHQQRDGVGDQGTEVRHGTDGKEHDTGEEAGLDAHIHDAQNTGFIPVFHFAVEIIEGAAHRQVGQEHTKCDGQEQQGLKLFDDGQIQQHEGDEDHHAVLPLVSQSSETGLCQQLPQNFKEIQGTVPP